MAGTGTARAVLDELVSSLATNTVYHWCVRQRYRLATTPFAQTCRSLTEPWDGWQEEQLRTTPNLLLYLPVIRR